MNQGSVYLLVGVFCGMCLFMVVWMACFRSFQFDSRGLVYGSVSKNVSLYIVMSCLIASVSALE